MPFFCKQKLACIDDWESQSVAEAEAGSFALQCINILFWLLQNAYIIGKDCSWFDQFVNGCTLVQWTCLNFVSILPRCSQFNTSVRIRKQLLQEARLGVDGGNKNSSLSPPSMNPPLSLSPTLSKMLQAIHRELSREIYSLRHVHHSFQALTAYFSAAGLQSAHHLGQQHDSLGGQRRSVSGDEGPPQLQVLPEACHSLLCIIIVFTAPV